MKKRTAVLLTIAGTGVYVGVPLLIAAISPWDLSVGFPHALVGNTITLSALLFGFVFVSAFSFPSLLAQAEDKRQARKMWRLASGAQACWGLAAFPMGLLVVGPMLQWPLTGGEVAWCMAASGLAAGVGFFLTVCYIRSIFSAVWDHVDQEVAQAERRPNNDGNGSEGTDAEPGRRANGQSSRRLPTRARR